MAEGGEERWRVRDQELIRWLDGRIQFYNALKEDRLT